MDNATKPTVWRYIKANLWTSVALWDAGHRMGTLIAAIIAALFAAPLYYGIQIAFTPEALNAGIMGLGLWFAILVLIVTPYRMWKEKTTSLNQCIDANKPKIGYNWRYQSSYADLSLWNVSARSITGIDVILRNHRKSDDTGAVDVMRSLPSNDGKRTPITLNPGGPMYFRIAELKNSEIAIASADETDRHFGQERVIKLSVSGHDMSSQLIYLHLIVKGQSIEIKQWEKMKR